jgi:LAS superfamily LD-carboxypeptidase LdcB
MKVRIKLSRKHPHNAMSFGRYMVTYQEQEIELNDAEIKDLKNEGPKYWFIVEKVEDEKPVKKVAKKASKKVSKKAK